MADLPRPDVTVTTGPDEVNHHVDVVISRDNKARSYRGQGATEPERTKSVIDKILGDHHSAEFIPSRWDRICVSMPPQTGS
jgi:hypothetical protein